jgi:hypothetical protein
LASEKSNSNASSRDPKLKSNAPNTLVICIDNAGYEAALERRKISECLPDSDAERRRLLRVIDESGEAYLYSEDLFVAARCPRPCAAPC